MSFDQDVFYLPLYWQVKVVNLNLGVGLIVRGGALDLNSLWSRGDCIFL